MQLISMEVNQLGTANRIQVGLLGSGLNAICGRKGSGKSSLLRWLGGMVQPTSDALNPHLAPSNGQEASGRVTLRVGPIEYQLERAQPATGTVCKLLRRTTNAWQDSLEPSVAGLAAAGTWTSRQREAFDCLTRVPSDQHAVDRLWTLAQQWDLDHAAPSPHAAERAALLAREQYVLEQLRPLEGLTMSREGLLSRRRHLEAEVERMRRENMGRRYAPDNDDRHRLKDRLAALDRDAQQARLEIADIDAALARLREGLGSTLDSFVSNTPASYRERLQSLDAQLVRWRRTLAEIVSHRQRLEASATDAQLDGQLGEQFNTTSQGNPRLALRALEHQLLEARRHFEALLDGVDRYHESHHDVRIELPQTLRLMQRELHEVCQQLSRHESHSVGQANRQQILQLTRCETEMRQAIERLIVERGELLREIAAACHTTVDQVSVAYSDSCRCADHPRLDAWLSALDPQVAMNLPTVSNQLAANSSQAEIASLENRRQRAVARLDDCQRDSRELESRLRHLGEGTAPVSETASAEADVQRELTAVNDDLQRLELADRLRVELSDVRLRLQHLPTTIEDGNSLRGRYYRHLAGLTGQSLESLRKLDASMPLGIEPQLVITNGNEHPPRYATYTRQAVPACYAELALRLAIAEALAARGEPISVCLDQTLDGRDGPQRLTAVRYLANFAEHSHTQICLTTDDQTLVEAVKVVRGNIVPMVVSQAMSVPPVQSEPDINRQLLAFANEWEADKWREPDAIVRRAKVQLPKTPWRLTERSSIDEVPSIGSTFGKRLRALGIERVRDLLQADPHWVADDARLATVDTELVQAWQSEARLLCSMPQLRPFDARVLAGAGVRDQHDLAGMHPSRLLESVESFLTTDRGRHILRSGSNHELSRITAWIASAKTGKVYKSARQAERRPGDFVAANSSRYDQRESEELRVKGSASRSMRRENAAAKYNVIQTETDAVPRAVVDSQPVKAAARDNSQGRARNGRDRQDDIVKSSETNSRTSQRAAAKKRATERFYLELSSNVVDAPSVGDSMAQELAKLNIITVNDLLTADAEQVANSLHSTGVTGGKVKAWQDQARLVCRTPNLRGHDAQILVACGITSPESLARMDADNLLEQVNAFVASKHGQRVLRGSPAPDLDEIHDWIRWAGHCRSLMAA